MYAELFYVDQGAGAPVVFVHGAWMDHRYWEPQREEVAAHYRFIAYTLRYHGTAPWPDDGRHYSTAFPVHQSGTTGLTRGTPVDRSGEPDIAADSAHSEAVNFDALPLPDISFEVRVPLCLPPVKPGAGSGESQAGDIGRGSGRRSYRQQP
jgi:hypothetical protein